MKLPPYDAFPVIHGNSVSLIQIQPSDINELISISFYDAIQASTLQQAMEMQAKIDQDYVAGNSIHWGIADHITNKIVGTCGYYRGFDNGTGELGCVLLPQYRGLGFMTAAMSLAIDFGLNNIGLNRIKAITSRQNEPSLKLLERLNFIKISELSNGEMKYELGPDV